MRTLYKIIIDIKQKLGQTYRISVSEHNKELTKNHEIVSKKIDYMRFCRYFEVPLRRHDERDDSANPGIFRGLILHLY